MKQRTKRKKYSKAQRSTSIYFLLWAAFSVFSLIIVMLFGFTQNILLKQSYKAEIAHNLAANGKTIQTELLQYTGSDYTIFVRYQASRYNLGVYILEEDGTILFPASETTTPDLDADSLDFTEKVERLKERLSSVPNKAVIYEDPTGEFVYGAEMSYNKRPVYLYVCKPLQLIENVVAQMNIRTLLLAVFVLLLSFTISSAISGVLTKPITILGGMEKESADMCIHMTMWITIVKPLVWIMAFIPGYGMRAAGDVKFSMLTSCTTMWLCRFCLSVFMIRIVGVGAMGVWIGMFSDWTLRGIIFSWRFHSRKWLKHQVI